MTRDELIQALYDTGVIPPGYGGTANQFDAFHRFADIVAARERERCAKVAEWILKMPENDISTAIRAMGDER